MSEHYCHMTISHAATTRSYRDAYSSAAGVRDPFMLEFLELKDEYSESDSRRR